MERYQKQFKENIALKTKLNEEYDYDVAQNAFIFFTLELEKLSKKYGILISAIGGVDYMEPSTIKRVAYSDDFSSGDLEYTVR